MTKAVIRQQYKEKRKALSDAECRRLDDLLLIQLQTLPLADLHHVLAYWPIDENKEPNTHLFCDYLEFRNPAVKILYPKSDMQQMTMVAIDPEGDAPFIKNEWNIHEPMEGRVEDAGIIDMVFVPLLAFDKEGYRVGYGKGFYDKYLADCRPDCIKIGFSYFEPVDVIEDPHQFDVPLNIGITPNNIYVF
jgi:5-formyltetrahydrofolate cyclo-ligase